MRNYGLVELKNCFAFIGSTRMKEIAAETGFIQRERQLKSSNILPFLFRNHTRLVSASLDELCLDLKSHHISMTKAGLNKRLDTNCVAFVQSILEELLSIQVEQKMSRMPILKNMPFLRMRILDGTGFNLPSHYQDAFMSYKKAGIKIQFEFDYISGQTLFIKTEDGKSGDTHAGFERLEHVQPKDLCVQDLGYYHLDMFEAIEQREAYFLSRSRLDTQFFLEVTNPPRHPDQSYIEKHRYNRIYMKDEIENLDRGCSKEWPILYIGRHKKLRLRCVLYRHTEQQEKDHKKRMARKHQKQARKVQKEHVLDLAGVSIYLTNLPDTVSKEEIAKLYGVRWQIELLFKTWKSHLKLVQIKHVKIERLLCHFYVQCIVLLLSMLATAVMRKNIWIHDEKRISEDLLIRFFSKNINQLSKASQQSLYTWRLLWKDFIPITRKYYMKTVTRNQWTLFS